MDPITKNTTEITTRGFDITAECNGQWIFKALQSSDPEKTRDSNTNCNKVTTKKRRRDHEKALRDTLSPLQRYLEKNLKNRDFFQKEGWCQAINVALEKDKRSVAQEKRPTKLDEVHAAFIIALSHSNLGETRRRMLRECVCKLVQKLKLNYDANHMDYDVSDMDYDVSDMDYDENDLNMHFQSIGDELYSEFF
jgi:hypothetical protein